MQAALAASENAIGAAVHGWLARYKEACRDEFSGDEEFTRWLEEDYAPIAGGWHY